MNIMMCYYSKVEVNTRLSDYSLVDSLVGALATHGTLSPLLTDGLLLQEFHLQWLDKLSCLDVLRRCRLDGKAL
jgi:hypothetical protein